MNRFVITGPESSGKTTLVHQLAKALGISPAEEYARDYINMLQRSYTYQDVIHIGHKQIEQYESGYSLFDTDLLTSYIWLEEKYNVCNLEWLKTLSKQMDLFYLLCKPDIPWQYDEQRENPLDRDRLFDLYLHYLQLLNKPFFIIEGKSDERFDKAMEFLITPNLNNVSI